MNLKEVGVFWRGFMQEIQASPHKPKKLVLEERESNGKFLLHVCLEFYDPNTSELPVQTPKPPRFGETWPLAPQPKEEELAPTHIAAETEVLDPGLEVENMTPEQISLLDEDQLTQLMLESPRKYEEILIRRKELNA